MRFVRFMIQISIFPLLASSCSDDIIDPINSPPVITSLQADENILYANSQTKVRCFAYDLDQDSLKFDWLSYPGSVSGEGNIIYWIAPDVGGSYPLICRVTDLKGEFAEARINFSVFGNQSPIYNIILDEIQNNWVLPTQPKIIVSDSTAIFDFSDYDFFDLEGYIFQNIPGLLLTTVNSFKDENRTSSRFQDYPYWHADYTLISNEEINSFFADEPIWASQKGWAAFYAKYSDASGIYFLSKIGFNGERNQALIYLVDWHGPLYGQGSFIFLTKNSEWEIKKILELWYS